MLGNASNPMLEQAEEGIQKSVKPEMQGALEKVVHAGLTIMYSPKLEQQRNARLSSGSDPVKDASEGAVRLVANISQQSGGKMPVEIAGPAAMIFALEYLDLVSKAKGVEITPDVIAQTAKAVGDAILPAMGLTKDKLAALMAKTGQGGAQPAGMAPSASPPPQAPQGIIGSAQGGM